MQPPGPEHLEIEPGAAHPEPGHADDHGPRRAVAMPEHPGVRRAVRHVAHPAIPARLLGPGLEVAVEAEVLEPGPPFRRPLDPGLGGLRGPVVGHRLTAPAALVEEPRRLLDLPGHAGVLPWRDAAGGDPLGGEEHLVQGRRTRGPSPRRRGTWPTSGGIGSGTWVRQRAPMTSGARAVRTVSSERYGTGREGREGPAESRTCFTLRQRPRPRLDSSPGPATRTARRPPG